MSDAVKPTCFERNDLLDDAQFWAILYQYWVKPRVGDTFDDGEQHFFLIRESTVNAFFRQLENSRTQPIHYPDLSVLLTLRNGWRIGVVLSMYPEDFEIQYVVAGPSSDELIVFGVNGGNSRLPALRWEELLVLRDAVVSKSPEAKAKALLLLFPSICLSSELKIDEVRQNVEQAWAKSGIAVEHVGELVGRLLDDFLEGRSMYPEAHETVWHNHQIHGWINDSHHSYRNPKVESSASVIPVIRELFSSLESGA